MDREAFDGAWRVALVELEAAKRAYSMACETGDEEERRAAARKFFAAHNVILSGYVNASNWPNGSPVSDESVSALPHRALPVGLATFWLRWAHDLAAGQLPEAIAHVTGRGRSSPTFHERRDIVVATSYLAHCRNGAIDDATPTKTLAALYSVSRRTIEKWARDERYAHLIGSPEEVADRVKQAGARYLRFGRSQVAISARDRKRERK